MRKRHLMLDMETLSAGPCPFPLQIALVRFDDHTIFGGGDHVIDPKTVPKKLSVDWDTVFWWFRNEGLKNAAFLTQRGERFSDVLDGILREIAKPDTVLWARGVDWYWVENWTVELLGRSVDEFNFRSVRDVRTVVNLFPDAVKDVPKTPHRHDAFWDCIYQIHQIQACVKAGKFQLE